MTKRDDDLPVYDATEQGVAQDFLEHSPHYAQRANSYARYKGNRQALADQLNSARSVDGVFKPSKPTDSTNYAVIYLRVSSEEQAKVGGTAEGYSIPYQRDACLNKAAAMGLVVTEEYVDAGHSAKSARRPELQRMLRELAARRVKYVIVHKIDRLARNRRDDFLINEAIHEAGASLISVVDLVDDTPQGKFNYTIQAGLAQLYVDNLAVEVMKGLTKKVESGGTPYRVPVGYVNKRRIEGVADIRWVEVDPERGPLITWAFEQYATGDWSIAKLREALTDKGFTTRSTRRHPGKKISVNGLHKILTNPYYTGIVPYQGAYHEGMHEALVDMETWLRVQDILRAHNAAGDKGRVHAHYLKGSVFCGGCGSRLVFSRNKGRGGTYDYWFCMGRRFKRTPCQRKAVLVSAVEAGVEVFYKTFQLEPKRATEIREAVHAELESERQHASFTTTQATKRLQAARSERETLLKAHYAGAVPLDMLKTEMNRLMREIASAEQELATAQASVADLEGQLERALAVAGNCAAHYAVAKPAVRRLMNQGFFTKLYVGEDGGIERADTTEPFGQLLERLHDVPTLSPEQGSAGEFDAATAEQDTPSASSELSWAVAGMNGDQHDNTQDQPLLTLGVKMIAVAEAEGFEPPDGLPSPAFKAGAFGRSATLPWVAA